MSGGIFVYVSNADSKDIFVFELDPDDGGLAAVQQVALDVPGQVMPMAVSPDRRFLYVAQRSDPYSVATLAINGNTGQLTLLGFAPLLHSTPHICTDRTGRWLFAASYQGNLLTVSPIGPQGFVQPPHQVLRTEPNPHSVQIDAANQYVLVPSLGGDVVLQWRFDSLTGQLSPNTPPSVRVSNGAGPRHFAFHPNNRFVYLLNELEASLYVFAYNPQTGTLSERQVITALPPGFDGPPLGMPGTSTNGGPKAADVHISPNGRFLYASERTTSTLAAFAVDSGSGRLEPIDSIPTEETPRSFNIDPTGRYLLAVGQTSHQMTVYSISRERGVLSELKRYAMGKNPSWVESVRLP